MMWRCHSCTDQLNASLAADKRIEQTISMEMSQFTLIKDKADPSKLMNSQSDTEQIARAILEHLAQTKHPTIT